MRVARQRQQSQAAGELVAVVDEVGQARLEHGQHAVLQAPDMHRCRRAGVAPGQPVGELLAPEQVAGVGKGRRPPAVRQLRVPADMVDVQVGAEDEVDRRRLDAGPPQPVDEARAGALVPVRDLRAVLVLADAGVDQDGPPVDAQHESLDGAAENVTGEVEEVGLEQAAMRLQRQEVEPGQELDAAAARNHRRRR